MYPDRENADVIRDGLAWLAEKNTSQEKKELQEARRKQRLVLRKNTQNCRELDEKNDGSSGRTPGTGFRVRFVFGGSGVVPTFVRNLVVAVSPRCGRAIVLPLHS